MSKVNHRLFFYELMFAISVVFVHVSFPHYEYMFDSIGRGAVAFFFILSSYFFCKKLQKGDMTYKDIIFRCLRLLIIEVVTIVIFFLTSLVVNFIRHTNPPLFSEFSGANISEYINSYMPRLTQMWFIHALVICYLLFPLIYKWKFVHTKSAIILPIAVLLAAYIFKIFALQNNWGFFSDAMFIRNFFFIGLPCFLIGLYILEHFPNSKIEAKLAHISFIILLICFIGLTLLESYLNDLIHHSEHEFYIFSILTASLCFMHAVKYPHFKVGEALLNIFHKESTTIMYFYHRLFLYIFKFLADDYNLLALQIFLAIASCLVVAIGYHYLKKIILSKIKKPKNA